MRQLHPDTDDLIAVAMNGYSFAQYAASRLTSLHHCYSEVRFWMLMSCFARKDKSTPRMYLIDWMSQDMMPKACVSRFVPGNHFHALDCKFNTECEARDYLRSRGYDCTGLIEKHVYNREGD